MTSKRAARLCVAHICAFLLMTASLYAQTGVSLEAEIQNMEKTASKQDVSAQEKHDALVRLARLRQLSGDIEGAAKNWLEAAAAIPGSVDDDALLSCAYCLAAMGEWDRAATALEPLLSKSPRARFLSISIYAIKTGDTSPLAAMAHSGDYSQLKSEIYFMLWKTSRAQASETWRRRLADEFPQTPEGRLASGAASAVSVRPGPFWLFMNTPDSLSLETAQAVPRPAPEAAASAAAERPAPETVAPAVSALAVSAPAVSVQTVATPPAAAVAAIPQPSVPQTTAAQTAAPQTGARLQTGIFGQRANAEAQITNLIQAGFSPLIEQRGEMWAVTVPAGADQTRTAGELKEAGFDSFLLR